MKNKLFLLAITATCLTSCWTARIYTVVPTSEKVVPAQTVYTTTVTTPTPKVTTVSTFTVTNYSTDPCFYLDLNAVAAAFAESRSVREFEQLLNSSRYMINNLDLNHDGWVDYLRVIETHRGYYNTLLLQACLAPGVFQDVATIVAEYQPAALYVEVIGDRYLYGYNYIVRPVFVNRPPMWDVYGRPTYVAWSSPYYYGAFPSYYTQPKPVYLNHYQAYVTTYMSNHHYCHRCDYPQQPHYSGYVEMTQPHRRNDYQTQHPDNSFERRVTQSARTAGVTVRNAGQLRTEVNRTSSKASASSSSRTSTTSASSSTRSSGTATSTSSSSRTSTTSASSSTRSSGTATSTSSSSRTSTTSASSSTRSSGTPTQPSQTTRRQPSTTVTTKVNKSGTTRTTVKTTDATGRTQTIKRESSSNRTSQNTSSRSSQGTTSESSPRSDRRGR